MSAHDWKIGQVIEWQPGRGAQVGEMPAPQWFAFTTPPQKERAAKAWLDLRGVDAWYPTETRWRHRPRAKIKREKYEATVVPRYILARFTGFPQWDILRACRYLSGVIGHDGTPLPVTDETLCEMRAVPAVLTEMKRVKIERETIRPGDRAEICDGPFAGWVVEVNTITAGLARFMLPLMGGSASASASITEMRKII